MFINNGAYRPTALLPSVSATNRCPVPTDDAPQERVDHRRAAAARHGAVVEGASGQGTCHHAHHARAEPCADVGDLPVVLQLDLLRRDLRLTPLMSAMPEAARAIALVAATLIVMIAWMSPVPSGCPSGARSPRGRAASGPAGSARAGLRGCLLRRARGSPGGGPGTALDTVLAFGFLVVAITAPLRDPREALTLVALAFVAHAVVDVLHGPGWLPEVTAPGWYSVGCAVHNLVAAVLCYAPLLRR